MGGAQPIAFKLGRKSPYEGMTNFQKSRPRPQPQTKDQLREMLAQAVRNTQPEKKPTPKASKGHG